MIRFLADADLNYAIVSGCLRREPAMDFLSANDAKLEGVSDARVLVLAAEQDRILVSHDFQTMPHHVGEFLETQGSSPGVFLVKQSTRVGDVIDELVLVWAASDADEWRSRILEIPL